MSRNCDFSGEPIEPGTGIMFIKRNGETLWFKNSKSMINALKLKRINRNVRWTQAFKEHRGGK